MPIGILNLECVVRYHDNNNAAMSEDAITPRCRSPPRHLQALGFEAHRSRTVCRRSAFGLPRDLVAGVRDLICLRGACKHSNLKLAGRGRFCRASTMSEGARDPASPRPGCGRSAGCPPSSTSAGARI